MQTTRTFEEVYAWEKARVNLSGIPREWTPSTWTNDDSDCATFQSDAFFGDLRYYVVSQFYNDGARSGQLGQTAQPGALACYKWPGSGDNFDHIGLVTSAQDSRGNFYSLEANTSGPVSGHQVAEKLRNVANVVGFVYPTYATSGAASSSTPIIPPTEDEENVMKFWSDSAGTIYYGAYPIPSLQRYAVLVRYNASTVDKRDTFNPVEAGWIHEALAANGVKQ